MTCIPNNPCVHYRAAIGATVAALEHAVTEAPASLRDQLAENERTAAARLAALVREWDEGERDYFAVGEDITDILRWWLTAALGVPLGALNTDRPS